MTTPTKRIDYSSIPLPTPPTKKPADKKDQMTQNIRKVAEALRRKATPHPSALKKAVTKK